MLKFAIVLISNIATLWGSSNDVTMEFRFVTIKQELFLTKARVYFGGKIPMMFNAGQVLRFLCFLTAFQV